MTSTVKLGDVADVISGYAFKSASFKEGGKIPVLKIKNIKIGSASLDEAGYVCESFIEKLPDKFQVYEGDILISLTGSHMTQPNSVVGRVGRYPKGFPQALLNQRAGKIIPERDKVNQDYLYYVLMQDDIRKEIAQMASGAASQANVSPNQVKSIEFLLPKLVIQKRLGLIFKNYDNLIENNNRRIAILEDMAQSLYREWFVHFRFPGHKECQFVDSELGRIPEGWEVRKFGELVHFLRDSVRKGSVEENTPYMGLEHFPRKSISLSDWELVNEIGSSKLKFEKGDILFGKIRPYFHKVGVAQTDGLCSSDTFVWRPIDKTNLGFIANIAFSEDFVAHSVQSTQGTKMPRANWDVLNEYKVAIPNKELLNQYNSLAKAAIREIEVLSSKNRNLKTQRDLLLPKLISGGIL